MNAAPQKGTSARPGGQLATNLHDRLANGQAKNADGRDKPGHRNAFCLV
jgi:hypothetical protein